MIKRLRVPYLICANTAVLLIACLVATDLVIRFRQYVAPELAGAELTAAELANYAHMTAADRDDLLASMRAVRFRYEPEVGLVLQAMASRFVNIDEHGIRANAPTGRPVAAVEGAVWLLGGSTVFGDGVSDSETIAAHLERILGRAVINFGVRSYSGSEENMLLTRYARTGYRPARVIFLDGVNERCDDGAFASDLADVVTAAQVPYSWEPGRPITYAYARLRDRVARYRGAVPDDPERLTFSCPRIGTEVPLAATHARMMAERAAICRLYGFACTTFVQPFAGVHGRRDGFTSEFHEGEGRELRRLFEYLERNWRDAGATFVTGALDGDDRHGFIDEVHYSAAASHRVAAAIAAGLVSGPATGATTGAR
jgi:hypothetical protein